MNVFHYCPASYVPDILASGALRPSSEGARARERAALWFTSSPTYDPTALKMWGQGGTLRRLTLAEQEARVGLARFAVDEAVAPLTWGEWTRTSGVRGAEVKRMARLAARLGSDVSLYRATYEAVPAADWAAVEVWRGGGWVPHPARV